jgi:hypothetical protein
MSSHMSSRAESPYEFVKRVQKTASHFKVFTEFRMSLLIFTHKVIFRNVVCALDCHDSTFYLSMDMSIMVLKHSKP